MYLRDFYKKTVYENDNEISGWSRLYYGVFSKVINDNHYKNIVEVGIGYGTHAKYILKNNANISRLTLVDPMKYYPNDQFATDIMSYTPVIPGNNFNELHDLINDELSPWSEKYIWLRKGSLDVTNTDVPNESVDCIFIDGDHSYEAVLNDLRFWWKKLRTGGRLLGDDYYMTGVESAVKQFAEEQHITFSFLYKPNTNYKIYCFLK